MSNHHTPRLSIPERLAVGFYNTIAFSMFVWFWFSVLFPGNGFALKFPDFKSAIVAPSPIHQPPPKR